MTDNAINIEGYNVFRIDWPKRGSGLAIYIKNWYAATLLISKSISKQFELLAFDVVFSKTLSLTGVGCYRPSSATN